MKENEKKRIAILGSTGSIGTQALDVIESHKEEFKVTVLSCAKRIADLEKQIDRFNPEIVVVDCEKDAVSLAKKYPKVEVLHGMTGLIDAAKSDYDMVLNSLMGMRGLVPTYYAANNGRSIAFANKETLVAGGSLIMEAAKKSKARLIPVDSEHSAIFQCLQGNEGKKIKKILLTASGGPFRGYNKEQLEAVTLEEALNHPKWTMGKKITVDSATMMNKGLEVIEARWLFDVPPEKIQILIHPQSVVHSMVEFEDTAIIAQMGLPDMRVPISYAFGYPDRLKNEFDSLDFFKEGANLTFEKPNPDTFTCIKLAYEVLKTGGSYPVAMNAANEELVDAFLNKKIRFIDIQNNIEKILESHIGKYNISLEDILEIDRETRALTKKLIR